MPQHQGPYLNTRQLDHWTPKKTCCSSFCVTFPFSPPWLKPRQKKFGCVFFSCWASEQTPEDYARIQYMKRHNKPSAERRLLMTFHGRAPELHGAYGNCVVRGDLTKLSQKWTLEAGVAKLRSWDFFVLWCCFLLKRAWRSDMLLHWLLFTLRDIVGVLLEKWPVPSEILKDFVVIRSCAGGCRVRHNAHQLRAYRRFFKKNTGKSGSQNVTCPTIKPNLPYPVTISRVIIAFWSHESHTNCPTIYIPL